MQQLFSVLVLQVFRTISFRAAKYAINLNQFSEKLSK